MADDPRREPRTYRIYADITVDPTELPELGPEDDYREAAMFEFDALVPEMKIMLIDPAQERPKAEPRQGRP